MRHIQRITTILLLMLSGIAAMAQQPQFTIESVTITGVVESPLSPGLRDDIKKLAGQPLEQKALDDLAERIQKELPEFVAATKQEPGSESGKIKLLFVIGRIRTGPGVNVNFGNDSNVNSKYTVENVRITGFDESKISRDLDAELQKLVGKKFDQESVDRLQKRLNKEISAAYTITNKMVKGTKQDQVDIEFDVRKAPWLSYRNLQPYLAYHSKFGTSWGLDVPIRGDDGDDLISVGGGSDSNRLLERFEGWRFSYENVRLVDRWLGVKVDYFTYHDAWNAATVHAVSESLNPPDLYRDRRGFAPSLRFAFHPSLSVSAGVSLTQLKLDTPSVVSHNANAVTGSVRYQAKWNVGSSGSHQIEANYDVRSAARNMSSDYSYTRHFGDVSYIYKQKRNTFEVSLMAGRISGIAPLFDRFSLGNTTTLRGWNKFDLAPLGGGRVIHGSVEYHYRELQLFYDTGAVWDSGQAITPKNSVGIGFSDHDWFASIGVPVRGSAAQPQGAVVRLRPLFMLGVQF